MTGTSIAFLVATALLTALIVWLIGERGRLMLPSTWAGMRAGGLRNFLNLKALHLYVYGRWPGQYLSMLINYLYPRLGKQGMKWIRDRYHGKVLTHDHASKIITLDIDIPRTDLEQIVPYPMARDLVLNGPPDVVAFECPCRHLRANPCQPTQVCMAIGKPFTDFMLEHHPGNARRLTQGEALELLRGEHERGHVHAAWFKDACLDRFYSICNCCKCCCGVLRSINEFGIPASHVINAFHYAVIDAEACTGCGICADERCQVGAIEEGEDAYRVVEERCIGCGLCIKTCPAEAIRLVRKEQDRITLPPRNEHEWFRERARIRGLNFDRIDGE